MTMRALLLLACIAHVSSPATAQSKVQFIELGDVAFVNDNYPLAAFYYEQALAKWEEQSKHDIVYPYQVISSEKRRIGKQGTNAAENGQDGVDSTTADSAQVVPGDKPDPARESAYQELLYKLANAYRLSFRYEDADSLYGSLVKKGADFRHLKLWYGQALMSNSQYGQAVAVLWEFNTGYPQKGDSYHQTGERLLQSCRFAMEQLAGYDSLAVIKEADAALNPGISNFSAAWIPGEEGSVLFASAVADSGLREVPGGGRYLYFTDIFKAGLVDGVWQKASAEEGVNSRANEGTPSAAAAESGPRLFFTRWDGSGKAAVYMSNQFNGRWLEGRKMNENVNPPDGSSMHPSFLAGENTLVFTSDRQGGYGKLDLWYVKLDAYGNAGPPVNLGEVVNTVEDDVTPFYHTEDEALYFSSSGRVGMGGLDVFVSQGKLGELQPPVNMGFPVNSSREDAYFIIDSDKRNAFLSSDRQGCASCDGGRCYRISELKFDNIITLGGTVYNKETKKIIPNALVILTDVNFGEEQLYVTTDDEGRFRYTLSAEKTYALKSQKLKFFSSLETFNTLGVKKSKRYEFDIFLQPIPEGEINIEGILYDYDKWDLRKESERVLDDLVELLNINPSIAIELSSHTDERGGEQYNETLSQKRAESCVNYLISKGIHPKRLVAKGYGEYKLLILHARTEAEHQKNRRTAFSVISQDFKQ